jgi:hypothetical protein
MEFAPKVVDRIIFGGELPASGSVVVTAGGVSHTFTGPVNDRSRTREFSRNNSRFTVLGVSFEASRGSDNTHVTPQALPIIIEGRAFLDERKAGNWLS